MPPTPLQLFSHYPALPPPRAVPLHVSVPHPCGYLPDRLAVSRAFVADQIDPEIYHQFMDSGFRRSGKILYQMACPGCRECRQLRLCVDRFTPTRSQRRAVSRNRDLVLTIVPQAGMQSPSHEKFDLYSRYVVARHEKEIPTVQEFVEFLYESPVNTVDFEYRDRAGRLLGVGICDVCASSLSTVYFYFDPEESARSLGTYGAMMEIDYCRRNGIPYYYLGYWVEPCAKMRYKAEFAPNEVLGTDGIWRALV